MATRTWHRPPFSSPLDKPIKNRNRRNRPVQDFVETKRRIPRLVLLLLATGCIFVSFLKISSPRSSLWFTSADESSSASRSSHPSVYATSTFDWKKLYASEKLNWVDCYDKFQCARLEVPLDYSKPHEEKAAIALLRYPSKYQVGDPRWRGPILHNPGGPGGSGVETMLIFGELLSRVTGDEYDHVGFDPRGIGQTTPSFYVFETDVERLLWNARRPLALNVSADGELDRLVALTSLQGELAQKRHGSAFVGKYLSTPIVARDMLQITRAFGREKLLYWGFSYGTILGATFATMFPDKIERMILDGIADIEDYYAGLWSDSLLDTDKAFQNVIAACTVSPRCALHSPNATTESVEHRVSTVLDSLRRKPLRVILTTESSLQLNYGLVDRDLTRRALLTALYDPRKHILSWFQALADAERGDGQAMFEDSRRKDALFRCGSESAVNPDIKLMELEDAIACSDASPIKPNVDELMKVQMNLRNMSEFAEFWVMNIRCSGWKIRPEKRFMGPIGSNTSHPILLLGNTADPVTPAYTAHKVSKSFPKSVVLIQNSTGHCTVSAPSICTAKHVREYFKEGILPAQDTVCEPDEPMFGAPEGSPSLLEGLSEEDRELKETIKELSSKFRVPHLGIAK